MMTISTSSKIIFTSVKEHDILSTGLVKAGQNAGCRTALIGEGEFRQDMSVSSLLEFVEKVIAGE